MEIRPEVTHGIVNRVQNSFFNFQAWPSLCRDENGTLYAVASGFRCRHICPFGKTVMYISKNGGKTWSPPIIINDSYLDDRDAGILYMGGGRMLVTWFAHNLGTYANLLAPHNADLIKGMEASQEKLAPEHKRGGSYIKISEDYGMTWSEAIRVPVSSPHGPNIRRDGSLIYLGKEMLLADESSNAKGKIRAIESRDGGYTWQELGEVPVPDGIYPENLFEPHAAELPDGRILGAIRAQNNANIPHELSIFTTYSSDGGLTWSTPECIGVNGTPPHLLLHSSGALICSYGRRAVPYGERAAVSRDFGKTWADEYILDERPTDKDLGYPATAELDDGSLVTVYYQKLEGDSNASILCSRWKLK